MARTQAQVFDDLLSRYETEIADAFRAAIDDLGAQADLARIIEALSRNDLGAAIDALHLDPAAYEPILDAVGRSYQDGGSTAAAFANKQTPAAVVIRFSGRNYRAEQWLKQYSSSLVTRILEDQRLALRQALTAGMERGENPRTTALDIVGRINRATGKREGGIVGLTSQQEAYARNARDELLSGDPAQLRNYLTRSRRSKLFDRSVLKAIKDGTPVPAETARKATVAYRNRLLQLRGEVIGQVEAFDALAAAKHEAYTQAIERGDLDAAVVTKIWRHFVNKDPRPDHIVMQGKKVGLNEPFILPDGTRMLYAHDPAAPIKHKAGCHCQTDYVIDYFRGLK